MNQLETIAKKREVLLQQYPHMVEEVTAVRQEVVSQMNELIAQAKETLHQKGDFVYEAKNLEEAQRIILDLCADKQKVVRIDSPELAEIYFDDLMHQHGKEVALTDLTEIILKQLGLEKNKHPFLGNLNGVSQEEIIKALQDYVGEGIDEPKILAKAVHQKIRQEILASDYGVTGVDAIVSENGTVILAENEGNVRAVSNLPYRHIIVAGYDRLYATAEEAMRGIQGASIFGLGKNNPCYYSLISGQSRTADIEFKMAYGMHGPLEVHVILLDNGRGQLISNNCGHILKCIDCGNCYSSLANLADLNGWNGLLLTMKNIALKMQRGELSNVNGLLDMKKFSCPVGICAKDLTKF